MRKVVSLRESLKFWRLAISFEEDGCSNFRLKWNKYFQPIKDNFMSFRVYLDSKMVFGGLLLFFVIVYVSLKQFVNNPRETCILFNLKSNKKKIKLFFFYAFIRAQLKKVFFRSFSIGEQLFDRLRPLQSCFF